MVYKVVNGTIPSGDEWMSNSVVALKASGRNLIRELQDRSVDFSADGGEWAEAYIDVNGQKDSVTGASAVFDTDKYKILDTTTLNYYLIIVADDASISWTSNNCVLSKLDSGKWLLYSTSADIQLERSEVLKSMFYGTTGINQLYNDFTNITSIKTNYSNDIGKQGYYQHLKVNPLSNSGSGVTTTIKTTFNNTSDNTNSSVWSLCKNYNSEGFSTGNRCWVYFPTGTIVNSSTNNASGLHSNDELGTDTSGDNQNNPADTYIACYVVESTYGSSNYSESFEVGVAKGSVTFSQTLGSGVTNDYTQISYPVTFTDGSSEDIFSFVFHTLPSGSFSSTISSSFGTALYEDWESGTSSVYKLTNTGGDDSGWLNENEVSTFTAFTAEPDTAIVKLVPKSGGSVGVPSIKGFSIFE